jgi:hypothetical protein
MYKTPTSREPLVSKNRKTFEGGGLSNRNSIPRHRIIEYLNELFNELVCKI